MFRNEKVTKRRNDEEKLFIYRSDYIYTPTKCCLTRLPVFCTRSRMRIMDCEELELERQSKGSRNDQLISYHCFQPFPNVFSHSVLLYSMYTAFCHSSDRPVFCPRPRQGDDTTTMAVNGPVLVSISTLLAALALEFEQYLTRTRMWG